MRPGAQSIMLPIPEGCALDTQLAGGTHPNGDETATNDGWAAFSGTSAATPQVAGVCALIKQACAGSRPREVRDILMSTARDVTTGTNHPNFGNAAVAGPDTRDRQRARGRPQGGAAGEGALHLVQPFIPIHPSRRIRRMPAVPARVAVHARDPVRPFPPFRRSGRCAPRFRSQPFLPAQPVPAVRNRSSRSSRSHRAADPAVRPGPGPGPGR